MSLRDRLVDAEPWMPADPKKKHPQELIGTIIDIDEGDGDYGSYPILYIRDEAGNHWRWHVFGGVAQSRIVKLRPEIGDQIGARFIGEKPSKNFKGKNYRDWRIVVEKAGEKPAGPNWDSMAVEDDDELDFDGNPI
jgi:hypothetical protein